MTAARPTALLLSFLLPGTGLLAAAALTPKDGQRARRHAAQAKPAATAKPTAPTAPDTFARDVAPLVKKYCAACHSAGSPTAGIALTGVSSTAGVLKARDTWAKVASNVQSQHMPPMGAPQPTPAERDKLVGWIQTTLSNADCDVKDPGRVTMRRLNRAEYANTIRDLVGPLMQDGKPYDPAADFPSDDVGYGFDNIGDVLSISPLLMEKYLNAAEKVARLAICTPDSNAAMHRFSGEELAKAGGSPFGEGGARILATTGELTVPFEAPFVGDYVLRVHAFGQQAGNEPVKMALKLDGKALKTVDVTAVESKSGIYEVRATAVPAGKHTFAAAFTNDFYDANNPDPNRRDRNMVVLAMEAVGPYGLPPTLPGFQRRLLRYRPGQTPAMTAETAARKDLWDFVGRAYRRPPTRAEVDRLTRCVTLAMKNGDTFEHGIQLAVEATLVSPNFLFQVEADPRGARAVKSGTARALNGYELASRLSYFLWSSMPDEELFKLAANGSIQKPAVLEAQVRRMMKDPKANALGDNFAMQWLTLRNLSLVAPNRRKFPDFNERLRAAMLTETRMFFNSIVNEDRSVLDFIDANYTFVNGPLARHYGIPDVTGPEFRRVTLTGDMAKERGGILSQASILTVTSNPGRTSPVKRGKWVLEQILGTPPPPAPPNVPKLKDDSGGPLTGTLRQRMEQHRKDPNCASCHARMDPLGFGLENYDATGGWRTMDDGQPLDCSGTLPDGRKFDGPEGLKKILLGQKTLFVHNLADKLMTYALGRGLESTDRCTLDDIVRTAAKHDYRFSSLVTAVVLSDPFRKRKVEGGVRS